MQQDSPIQGSITSSQLTVTHWISMTTGSHPRELTIHRYVTQMFESPEIAIFWSAVPVPQFTKEYFRKKVIMDKNIFNGNSESSSQSFSLYHRAGRNLFNSNRSLSLSELSGKDYCGRAARDWVEAPRLFSYYTCHMPLLQQDQLLAICQDGLSCSVPGKCSSWFWVIHEK